MNKVNEKLNIYLKNLVIGSEANWGFILAQTHQTIQYYADQVNPLPEITPAKLQQFSWLWQQLEQQQKIVINNISELPAAAGNLKIFLKEYKIGAFVSIPLIDKQTFIGVLFVAASQTKNWHNNHIFILENWANIIVENIVETNLNSIISLVEYLPGIVFRSRIDQHYSMAYLSQGCKHLTGYDSQELMAQNPVSYNDIIHPEDLPRILAIIRQAVEQKCFYEVQYRIFTRAKTEKWFWEKGRLIYDVEGKVIGIEGFITDITSLKLTEILLANQKRVLEMTATEAPLSKTLDYLIATIEAQGVKKLGYIMLCDRDNKYLQPTAAPSLPHSLSDGDQNISIEFSLDELANPVHNNSQAHLLKIKNQQLLQHLQEIAGVCGMQTYWTFPIFAPTGKILGILVVYHCQSDLPSSQDWQLIKTVTHLAAISIERHQILSSLSAAEAKYRGIFEHISEGIFQTTPDGRYLSVNPALAKMYGYDSPQELIDSIESIEQQIYANPHRHREMNQILAQEGVVYNFESEVYRKDGSKIWVSENARAVYDRQGKFLYYEGSVKDISDRRQAEAKLRHDAHHDSLTELPNRAWFMSRLTGLINLAQKRQGYKYAILFLDLDNFKVVNDSLGHLVGDELLQIVTKRIQARLRSHDCMARLGGDEFVIILENIETWAEAEAVAERLQSVFKLPYSLQGQKVQVGVSIGITTNKIAYHKPEELLRDADIALYQAKANGKGCYKVFSPQMQTAARERVQLEQDLRLAIRANQLQLYYQPIVELNTGKLRGFEVLLRWRHPHRGWVKPAELVSIAESIGLIGGIDWWVLQQACHQIKQWQQQHPHAANLTVNVNLSPFGLQQPKLVERIKMILEQNQLDSRSIRLEITESSLLTTVEAEVNLLKRLKDIGIGLCIDDFGTGYSCLSRLHSCPVDTLKIDRSFIDSLEENDSNQTATIKMILALAETLNLNVICEGIETAHQLKILKSLGCKLGQGYLFSQPIDAATASLMIAPNKSNR